jgi:membrane-bound inhibitor of C-type lysozyme
MRLALIPLIATGLFAGAATAQTKPVAYRCSDGSTVKANYTERPGNVVLILGKFDSVVLPAVEAASGNKYQKGKMLFWTKGASARLKLGGREVTCDLAIGK